MEAGSTFGRRRTWSLALAEVGCNSYCCGAGNRSVFRAFSSAGKIWNSHSVPGMSAYGTTPLKSGGKRRQHGGQPSASGI